MVIASGRASQESAIRYTKAMLDLYQSTYRAMVPTINPFEFLQNPMASGSATAQTAASPAKESEDKASSAAQAPTQDEMSQLKARLAELEKAMSGIAPQKTARPVQKATRKHAARKTASRKKRK
jgi:hypothetical protein